MRVQVTNDDGIESAGLHALVAALAETGHEVIVAAPDRDWSGAGASLGQLSGDEHIDVTRVELPGLSRIEAWAVAGPPALTVVAARLEAFGPSPDLVVSGINAGLNTGRSTLFSGTIGACLAAQNFGLSGLAVSVERGAGDQWYWDTAARLAVDVLPQVIDAPRRSVVNLNAPARPYDEVLGVRWARLAPFGAVRSAISGVGEGRLQFELRPTNADFPPDSDTGLVTAGYATLTTLVGIAEAWPSDDGSGPGTIELTEGLVPGAPLEPVHRVPDADRHRSLRRPAHEDE